MDGNLRGATMYTALLIDGTICAIDDKILGGIDPLCFLGEEIPVLLYDEDGLPTIKARGILAEILNDY